MFPMDFNTVNGASMHIDSTSEVRVNSDPAHKAGIASIQEAVKFVQQTKLIPSVPYFLREGLSTANLAQFHQWLQAGAFNSLNIQGLVQIEYDPNTGGVVLRITQLIAGFLIGPRGLSIRDLAQGTGCVIKSWIEDSSIDCPRDTRVFVLEGSPSCVLMCLDVVISAIDRYRDLAEGNWRGQYVNKTQKIKGFVFVYYPPPKDRVPMAAGIKGFPTSSKQAMRARSLLNQNLCNRGLLGLENACGTQAVEEEIDDLGASYPGIFPGRVYNPELQTNRLLQQDFGMPLRSSMSIFYPPNTAIAPLSTSNVYQNQGQLVLGQYQLAADRSNPGNVPLTTSLDNTLNIQQGAYSAGRESNPNLSQVCKYLQEVISGSNGGFQNQMDAERQKYLLE